MFVPQEHVYPYMTDGIAVSLLDSHQLTGTGTPLRKLGHLEAIPTDAHQR